MSLPSYSCVKQVHTLQYSFIINTAGMKNLMIKRVEFIDKIEQISFEIYVALGMICVRAKV